VQYMRLHKRNNLLRTTQNRKSTGRNGFVIFGQGT
jgi:hypothetical protein